MKKLTAITVLVCCFVISAKAQVEVKPGLRAGACLSNFTDSDFNFRANFYVGGFVAVKLSKRYTLQPEINYSQQGAKATFLNSDLANHAPSTIKLNYLSVALLNKLTFSDKIYLVLGPAIDFQTRTNVKLNSDIDLAATLGVGYTLPVGLTIEARAKLGIIDVLESDDYNNANNYVGDWNSNYMFQLGVAYSFDVKGATN